MLKSPLEDEVVKLSDEVARLQIMVERCVENNNKMYNYHQNPPPRAPSQNHNNNSPSSRSQSPAMSATNNININNANPFTFSAPTDPLTALPSLFTGKEGTARLFRVLVESYPWLLEGNSNAAPSKPEQKQQQSSLAPISVN